MKKKEELLSKNKRRGAKKTKKTVRRRVDGLVASRVLALDISTNQTGYAFYTYEGMASKPAESGVIEGSGHTAPESFPGLVCKIAKLMDRLHPELVVVEESFYRKSFASIEYLLKLQGVVEAKCIADKMLFAAMPIPTWRSEMGFPRNLDKQEGKDYKALSMEKASGIAGREITNDNEADAICIGRAAIMRMSGKIEKE